MSNCQLELRFLGAELVANGALRGEVVVHARTAVATKGISVALGWKRALRDGSGVLRVVARADAFSGTIPAGESSYPFELAVPSGPLSYEGDFLKIRWELTATVDLAWAIDPTVTEVVQLVPGDGPNEIFLGPSPALETGLAITREKQGTVGWAAAGIFAFVSVGFAVGYTITHEVVTVAMSIAAALIAAGTFWFLVARDWLAERKLGPVTVEAPSALVHPGSTIPVTVRFTPAASVVLNAATATLVGTERAHAEHGKKPAGRSELANVEALLAERQTLSPGAPVEWKGTLLVPPAAPTTFRDGEEEIAWVLTVRLELAGWPDWSETGS